MAAISHIVPHDPDLDLGRLPEGNVLTTEQQQKLQTARERKAEQLEHFTSKGFTFSLISYGNRRSNRALD